MIYIYIYDSNTIAIWTTDCFIIKPQNLNWDLKKSLYYFQRMIKVVICIAKKHNITQKPNTKKKY